ncbi:diguanylate cyclase [uncultured Tateyamaria sp.]|uniref:diguanylate cyclase n=1 Tax=uncultured Tateyamaria sp. TaxID=455651 RepID=UPI0026377A1B|nr:diguanylate cyclase [uncultured Tateyamaria sp.]
MHGKILVIDAIATNRIVLRVKLAASHYEIMQAGSIGEAMGLIAKTVPDMILCADTLPDGDAVRLLARLRKVGLNGKVPVMVIGAPGATRDRQRLFAAGVEDVLERPVDDMLLLARTRSVMRAYASASEWTLRDGTSRALGFAEPSAQFGPRQSVRVISTNPNNLEPWQAALRPILSAHLALCTPATGVTGDATDTAPDAFVLVIEPDRGPEMLGLLATIRSHGATRHSAIMVVQVDPDPRLGAQMLDMGANDLMGFDRDPAELALRLDTLMARKRMSDALRDTVRSGIEAAVIDPLTGLHNRRYAMPHLARIADRSAQSKKPFAVMVADMDHFKRINDTHGHAAGDAVLVETARRLRENLRAVDLVARIGGEEFLIVMPGAGLSNARKAAQRLCRMIRNTPFEVPGQATLVTATISIGLTVCDPTINAARTLPMNAEALLDRADKALYGAKAEGRDRVTLLRPAA